MSQGGSSAPLPGLNPHFTLEGGISTTGLPAEVLEVGIFEVMEALLINAEETSVV